MTRPKKHVCKFSRDYFDMHINSVMCHRNANIRDKEGREADSVVLKDGKVDELWEAKLVDASPSPHLRYFAERIKPRRVYQVVHAEVPPRWHDNICVVAASRILSSLAEVPTVLPTNKP